MENNFDSNVMMASLFANVTEGIIVANRKGEIVMVNPSALTMFGYGADELTGNSIELLLPDALRHKHTGHRESFHQKPVNRAMGAGRDLYARRKDGNVFPVEISLSHYRLNDEDYAIAFIIDITVRKHNEEVLDKQRAELMRVSNEVKVLNTGLEQKIQDRTTMLRETLAQLESSKLELERSLEKEKELNDLKSRFVSSVSHEFRTPLAAVLSSVSLLAKYTKTEEQAKREKHIGHIKENVRHLSIMLEDLLSLGKLEEGLVVTRPEYFLLDEFLQGFIAEMQEVAGEGITIVHRLTGNVKTYTDRRLLKNILFNLVSNAIKFSPDGGEVYIKIDSTETDLIIEVSDNGIGISEEDCQHLFQRFFRARNAANIQGTGLGLHIVSKYLELLKGDIQLKSEINKGTKFTIHIPIQHEQENSSN